MSGKSATLLWICGGGALGTCARYLLASWLVRFAGAFPYGTLVVNLCGSFLMSVVMCIAASSQAFSPTVRLTLTSGVLGGFTTYSSFNYETILLFQQRAWWTGITNILVTLFGCLIAGVAGWRVTRLLIGA